MNRKLINIAVVILAVPAAACSILENREACPCIAEVTVIQQTHDMTYHGHVDCYIVKDSTVVASSFTGGLLGGDAMMEISVWPRNPYQVILSSLPMKSMTVRAEYGSEIDSLFAHVGNIACTDEKALYKAEIFYKEFTTLSLTLEEHALEYADRIEILVEGPYDGLVFPSLKASEGRYCVRKKFSADGKCPVRLPRQETFGTTLTLLLDGERNAKYDVVSQMLHNGYNFTAQNLADMRLVVSLNRITGNLNIYDWTPVEMGDQNF